MFEILCGAPVGALVGAIVGVQGPYPPVAILIGALIGGVLGFCVGASRTSYQESTLDSSRYAGEDVIDVATPL
jgi:hypothetical protein